jgi:hypothetical protein
MFSCKRLALWTGFLVQPRSCRATNRRTTLHLEVLEDRAVPSVTIGVNVTGNTLTDVENLVGFPLEPPDSDGSVGPNHYVEFTNATFAIYNKSDGSVVSKVSDTTFWSNAGIGAALLSPGLSDTRIIFDPASQRWFAIEITTPSTGNSVLVARSNSADPTQGFQATSFVADSGFADFPTLGVNADSLDIGTNNFTSITGFFKGVSLFNIPKSDLLQNPPTVADLTRFANMTGRGTTFQAATDFGASTGHDTVLSTGGSSTIDAFRVNNPGAAGATLSATTGVSVPAYSAPPAAQQPGTTITLDTNDQRISGGVFRVGDVIYEVHATTLAGRAALAWDKISDSTRTLLQQGTIGDSAHDYYYGSIAANANGDVVIGYTRSSSTEFASAYASVGSTSGGVLSFGAPILLMQGTAYFSLFGSPERWGDFSATSLDPSNSNSFWTVQEFATTDAGGSRIWATQVTQIIVSSTTPPTGVGSANPSAVAPGGTTLLTVAVTPGTNPTSTGLSVSGDLSSIGGSATQTFYDDGTHGDAVAGDGIFSFQATVSSTAAGGATSLPFTVTDAQGRSGSGAITLNVTAPTNPTGSGSANPAAVLPGAATLLTVAVTPGANPTSTGLTVTADLSSIGGSATQTFYDDGTHGDAVAGDGVFSFQATVSSGTAPGVESLPFTISDAQGRSSSGSITLTVSAPNPVRNIEDFDTSHTYNLVFPPLTFALSLAASQPGTPGDLGLINHPGGDWIWRGDAAAQVGRGDTITAWVQFHNQVDGRAYFAFGAFSLATYSLVLVPGAGTNQLLLQQNSFMFPLSSTIGSHTAAGAFLANHWYRIEVAWGASGLITGRVFDGSSTTPFNSVSAQDSAILGFSGGIGFHATGTNDKYWDSITAVHNLSVVARPPDGATDRAGDFRDVFVALFAGAAGGPTVALPLLGADTFAPALATDEVLRVTPPPSVSPEFLVNTSLSPSQPAFAPLQGNVVATPTSVSLTTSLAPFEGTDNAPRNNNPADDRDLPAPRPGAAPALPDDAPASQSRSDTDAVPPAVPAPVPLLHLAAVRGSAPEAWFGALVGDATPPVVHDSAMVPSNVTGPGGTSVEVAGVVLTLAFSGSCGLGLEDGTARRERRHLSA